MQTSDPLHTTHRVQKDHLSPQAGFILPSRPGSCVKIREVKDAPFSYSPGMWILTFTYLWQTEEDSITWLYMH